MGRGSKIDFPLFLAQCEKMRRRIHLPKDMDVYLIGLAMTTRSFGRFRKIIEKTMMKKYGDTDYQSFEFFGDALLHWLIRSYVFFHYGHHGPWLMTRISSVIEQNQFFLHLMVSRDLQTLLFTNSSTAGMGKKHPLCADVFEALVGAIYYHFTYVKGDETEAYAFLRSWLFHFWNLKSYIQQAYESMTVGVSIPSDMFPCQVPNTAWEQLQLLHREQMLDCHITTNENEETEYTLIYRKEPLVLELATEVGNSLAEVQERLQEKAYQILAKYQLLPCQRM